MQPDVATALKTAIKIGVEPVQQPKSPVSTKLGVKTKAEIERAMARVKRSCCVAQAIKSSI